MKTAVVALIIKDGLILSISRRDNKDKFGLIGGKVDDKETLHEALIREVYEETNLNISDMVFIFEREEPAATRNGLNFFTYCYYCQTWSGTPTDSEEGLVRWLTAGELTGKRGAFPDYNRRTLDAFKKLYPNVMLIGE